MSWKCNENFVLGSFISVFSGHTVTPSLLRISAPSKNTIKYHIRLT